MSLPHDLLLYFRSFFSKLLRSLLTGMDGHTFPLSAISAYRYPPPARAPISVYVPMHLHAAIQTTSGHKHAREDRVQFDAGFMFHAALMAYAFLLPSVQL